MTSRAEQGFHPGAPTAAPAWDQVAPGYADFIVDRFEHYAAEAIRLAGVEPSDAVLDVATGPGTLARQAARITRVHALDLSEQMLAQLHQRATPAERDNLVLQQGDGQALPYDDASFDAAFSMFGLFMFPDRARGFAELARVVRPGGRAVVASWQPQDEVPAFTIINEELAEEFSTPSSGGPPLSDPAQLEAEMSAAGFEVQIHAARHTWQTPSLDALWNGLRRSHVFLAVAAEQLPKERYEALLQRIVERLHRELGPGPQPMTMGAWLGLGRRSAG